MLRSLVRAVLAGLVKLPPATPPRDPGGTNRNNNKLAQSRLNKGHCPSCNVEPFRYRELVSAGSMMNIQAECCGRDISVFLEGGGVFMGFLSDLQNATVVIQQEGTIHGRDAIRRL